MIEWITNKQANKVIEERVPKGTYLLYQDGHYIGIDNSSGDAFVESFESEPLCRQWLQGNEVILCHTDLH